MVEDSDPFEMENQAESILLTVKTNSKELIGLNLLVRQVCNNQDLTWAEFFLQTANVLVDPNRYKVCSIHHGEFLMDNTVVELISKFKRKMTVYRVNIKATKCGRPPASAAICNRRITKKKDPLVALGLRRCPQGTFKVLKPQRNPKAISTNQWRQRILRMKHEMPTSRIAMTNPDDPISHQRQPTSSTRSFSQGFQPSSPRVEYVNEEFQFLPSDNDVFQTPDIDGDVGDFDDTASIFTIMSQASQYDLAARGIVYREVKTNFDKTVESYFSNDLILVVMDELKKLDSNRWLSFSKHAPTAAYCMTALFLLR